MPPPSRATTTPSRGLWAAWLLTTSCYLGAEKHSIDERGATTDPGMATDLDARVPLLDAGSADRSAPPPGCTSNLACPLNAPVCEAGRCVGCTKHDDCGRFESTPACASGACVACTADKKTLCTGPTPACDTLRNQCVQCVERSDCSSATASVCGSGHVCEPCATSADCSHIAGKNVCLAGTCVECTASELSACRSSPVGGDPIQYVCDPTMHACDRTRIARGKNLCETCISDLECAESALCVDVPAGAGQRVCQPVFRQAGSCTRPFISVTERALTTADGQQARVCTLRVDGATCEAHRQYSNTRCGSSDPAAPMQDLPGSGDASRCGASGKDDGYCVWLEGIAQYRCTVGCNNDVVDCPTTAQACGSVASLSTPVCRL